MFYFFKPTSRQIVRSVLLILTPLMCGSLAFGQEANPTECANLTKALAALSTQLQVLQDSKNSPQYVGPAATLYEERVKTLQQQISGETIAKNAACKQVQGPSIIQNGYLQPKYFVMSVGYAPPGGKGAGQVEYSTESEMETKVSSSNTDKADFKVSATLSGGAFGDDVSASFGFGTSVSSEDDKSVALTKSVKYDLKVPGPSADGINHDEDKIYLLLNPQINMQQVSTTENNVARLLNSWGLSVAGPSARSTFVYAGWLNGHGTMDAGTANLLASANITPADYPNILAVDPFALGSGNPLSDTSRYAPTTLQFPYVDLYEASDPTQTISYTLTNELQDTQSHGNTADQSMTVDVDVKLSGGFVSTDLKISQGWEFTYKKTTESSTKATQSATLTVGQPSPSYSGPVILAVYYDTIFQTYVFVGIDATGAEITGTITDGTTSAAALAHQEVMATIGGKRFRTYTNKKGQYTVMVKTPSQPTSALIEVNGVQKSATIGGATKNVTVNIAAKPVSIALPHHN